jgi:tetratricopeptide (TPR) repeat protein
MSPSRYCPRAAIRFEDALRELWRVHDLEQARLLRVASFLRARSRRDRPRPTVPAPRARGERSGGRNTAGWRAEALEEVRTAREDGADVHPILARLVRCRVDAWPSAIAIAVAALDRGRSHVGLVALARAQLIDGDVDEALSILHEVLVEEPPEDLRLEALEAAAVGLERAGDMEGALAFYEAALDTRGGDLRQAVPLLAIALCAGDDVRASVARDRLHRLDLGVPGVRSCFRAALSSMRRRLDRFQGSFVRDSPALEARVRKFLAGNRGPEAVVAELVLNG